jgi:hypothetical protein
MGTPPACAYATLYYALHEQFPISEYEDEIFFYRQYIDDIFAIWIPPATDTTEKFNAFKSAINNFGTLTWTVKSPSQSVVFLDLQISIRDNRIQTKMNEKVMNLYLYISPHSTHPPGVLYGLIVRNLYRIITLCSDRADDIPMAQRFLCRLAARGYRRSKLNELFNKAFVYLKKPQAPATPAPTPDPFDDELDAHNDIHFIVPYHPQNPSSKELQRLWRTTVFEPPSFRPVNEIPNDKDGFLSSVA